MARKHGIEEEVGGHGGEEERTDHLGVSEFSSGDTSERLGTEEKCDQMLILKVALF